MIILYVLADIAVALLLVAGISALAGDIWQRIRAIRRQAEARRHQLAAATGPVSLTDAQIGALASTIMCTSCRDNGSGPCTCTIGCGHLACTGGLSPEAAEFLRSLTMPPEGTGQ